MFGRYIFVSFFPLVLFAVQCYVYCYALELSVHQLQIRHFRWLRKSFFKRLSDSSVVVNVTTTLKKESDSRKFCSALLY